MPYLDENMSRVSLLGMLGFFPRKCSFSPKISEFLFLNCLVHSIDSCLNIFLYKMALAIVNLVFKEL